MTVFKVWLREPQQTDDEAIKLTVDEFADVSDILLKVPELLRVQHLKPSEIQAEYRLSVLSNRSTICDVFEGATEGTLVIRPRPEVNIVQKISKVDEKTSFTPNASDRCFKNRPPPSPRNQMAQKSPRVPTGSMKRVVNANSRPIEARGSSRGPSPSRGLTPTRLLTPLRCSTPSRSSGGVNQQSNQKNDKPVSRNDHHVVINRSSTPTRDSFVSSRRTHMKDISSRFRQEADKIKVPAKRNLTDSVCETFKPQWGKPLCATCNHSKQAHWVYHREKNTQPDRSVDYLADNSAANEEFDAHIRSPNDKPMIPSGETNDVLHNLAVGSG